ncbi:MAG TPA: RtcB family protein [Candidatus Paceibacterota bacterium]|nr:RtcB family protein [Candidatus Paceibacterota bacterium]
MAENNKIELKKIGDYEWEIPKTGKMLVPGKIFASEKLLKKMKEDMTLEQVKNVAMLPGIIRESIALMDAHSGYGFSIGGVAAFDIDSGVISPGGVGYDINCSVRLLKTNLTLKDIEKKKKEVIDKLFRDVPSGVGKKGRIRLSKEELNEVLVEGAQWAVKKGYGVDDDWKHTEDNGKLEGANPKDVSDRARARGMPQLGSLGAGNHFLEVQVVDEIFDSEIAKIFGLKKGQITIMIHCGSRGLGHQVASDYIRLMEDKYSWPEQDRELVNAPIKSELGKKYFSAMACAANFAFANKQLITHWVRDTMKKIFPKFKAQVVYDVCHNIAKFETHIVDGKEKEVLVCRKGATRAFGAGRKEIPSDYREIGQPVIIPGSMGTSSYVLVGTKKAEELSWGSTAHGAGRVSSRSAALRNFRGEDIKKQLNEKGIEVISGSWKGLAEEAPQVYKDIDEVVKVSDKIGIGKLVAKVIPLAVMKG